jgi:hypothetical protein
MNGPIQQEPPGRSRGVVARSDQHAPLLRASRPDRTGNPWFFTPVLYLLSLRGMTPSPAGFEPASPGFTRRLCHWFTDAATAGQARAKIPRSARGAASPQAVARPAEVYGQQPTMTDDDHACPGHTE